MCGICGKFSLNGEPLELDLIERMTALLSHRGPDDQGIHLEGAVALGHRRLSIIDLSEKARQPIPNEDRTIWLVCNGEIYNYSELQEKVLARGHRLRSGSDNEVILHLYEDYGAECLRFLRGMFAFAVWDGRKQELFLARDRLGKKPLFYAHTPQSFHFGSEIKAITADEAVPRSPDLTAIHHYLTYQYVPTPWTAFEGIRKLPPAHYMIVNHRDISIHCYWKLKYLPKLELSEEELAEQVRERLREAVNLRMVSDVPLGAFLSGGVDSSCVVALMSEAGKGPVKTFSIGFREKEYDELPYARLVAERFDTDHMELVVEPNAIEVVNELTWHYNEPFADSSAVPTYYVSRMAREHVTVVLNGDGGDENFAGYNRYLANARTLAFHGSARFRTVRMVLPAVLSLLRAGGTERGRRFAERVRGKFTRSPEMENALRICHFDNEGKEQLYSRSFSESTRGRDSFRLLLDVFAKAEADNFLDRALSADVTMYLPDDLLVKVDVASMANSLEARSPFLDHKFMEFAARIPARFKIKNSTTKYILKQSMGGILPDEVLERSKMGFGVPIDQWFRGELREMVHDTVLSPRAISRGYFKEDALRKIVEAHVTGRANNMNEIWDLLMLELWHQRFIDRREEIPPSPCPP